MEQLLHNVDQLSSATRSAVEALIGHPLRDDQQLYIAAIKKTADPSVEERRHAWDELQKIIADLHSTTRRSGAPAEQVERTIDEECETVRYGKKPYA
jgi:hypothetical protein